MYTSGNLCKGHPWKCKCWRCFFIWKSCWTPGMCRTKGGPSGPVSPKNVLSHLVHKSWDMRKKLSHRDSIVSETQYEVHMTWVQFLMGTQNVFFVPRLWQDGNHLYLFSYQAQNFPSFLLCLKTKLYFLKFFSKCVKVMFKSMPHFFGSLLY